MLYFNSIFQRKTCIIIRQKTRHVFGNKLTDKEYFDKMFTRGNLINENACN